MSIESWRFITPPSTYVGSFHETTRRGYILLVTSLIIMVDFDAKKIILFSGSVGKNGEPADILNETIGHFGKWQFRISLMMALLKFPMAWFQLGIIFLAPPTQYWCKPPKQYKNLTEHAWIALSRLTTTSNQTVRVVLSVNVFQISLLILFAYTKIVFNKLSVLTSTNWCIC